MEEILKRCKCGVYLTVNEHRDYYESVEERLKSIACYEDDMINVLPNDLQERMAAVDTIYEFQFYPDTPIGSYKVYGTSLEEVVEKAKLCLDLDDAND